GRIPAGRVSHAFTHSTDILPTLCEAAGIKPPPQLPLDGISLHSHFRGGPPPTFAQRGTVFWQLNLYKRLQRHYPKPMPYATEIARRGQWKLLALDGKPVELFDVKADPY